MSTSRDLPVFSSHSRATLSLASADAERNARWWVTRNRIVRSAPDGDGQPRDLAPKSKNGLLHCPRMMRLVRASALLMVAVVAGCSALLDIDRYRPCAGLECTANDAGSSPDTAPACADTRRPTPTTAGDAATPAWAHRAPTAREYPPSSPCSYSGPSVFPLGSRWTRPTCSFRAENTSTIRRSSPRRRRTRLSSTRRTRLPRSRRLHRRSFIRGTTTAPTAATSAPLQV